MIKINSTSLKDFQLCSRLYAYRYGTPVEAPTKEYVDIRDRRAQKYDETIKRVAAFFFYKKQSYSEPSYPALQNRWSKLWFADGTNAVDIATMKNEVLWANDTTYTGQAAAALLQFYDEFSDNMDTEVVLVDEKFCVPLNKEVALEGTFDLVLREKLPNGTYHYKIYKWVTSSFKKPLSFWTFDLAFLDFAFRYRNSNKPMQISYYIWNFGTLSPGSKEIELEKQDYAVINYWADTLKSTEVFVNRYNLTSYCNSCAFKKPCSVWTPELKEKV